MEPLIGQIILFAGNFAPRGWALCQGQLLSISQHAALFSILGTTYGGNGKTTFALPDLRGCVPIGAGQGTQLSPHQLGDRGGSETVTLTEAQLPTHTHTLQASTATAASKDPANNLLAKSRVLPSYATTDSLIEMHKTSIASTGAGQPHNNMPPFLTLNYIIAIEGIFPPRNA